MEKIEYYSILIIVLLLLVVLLLIKLIRSNRKGVSSELETIKNDISLTMKDNFNDINNILYESNEKTIKETSDFKIELVKSYSDTSKEQVSSLTKFKEDMVKELSTNFITVNSVLELKLLEINKDMTSQLDKNFSKTNNAFSQMIERLAKIDEAQKKIESLSTNIVSLQDILSDKKARGTFGEVQLNNILKSIFGEVQEYYQLQVRLTNGTIVDALLKVPDPVGSIAIDSKFPLEGYKKMIDIDNSEGDRKAATQQFKRDLKKHIDDISLKYILPPITGTSAILFLPAEAIFAHINAHMQDVLDYANSKKVWITSPTTMMATLSSMQVIVQNIEQSKYAKIIQEHLLKLNEEFVRYAKRWDNLARHIGNVSDDAKDIHTTTKKISSQFEKISNVNFEKKGEDLIEE